MRLPYLPQRPRLKHVWNIPLHELLQMNYCIGNSRKNAIVSRPLGTIASHEPVHELLRQKTTIRYPLFVYTVLKPAGEKPRGQSKNTLQTLSRDSPKTPRTVAETSLEIFRDPGAGGPGRNIFDSFRCLRPERPLQGVGWLRRQDCSTALFHTAWEARLGDSDGIFNTILGSENKGLLEKGSSKNSRDSKEFSETLVCS